MKFNELMRAFFRKMVQIRRNFVTTCTIRSTQGAKLPADATFSGRSMVEMLGVLAIIGVLSVGAIAGYSKAMMKYKLNKWTEDIVTLLSVGLNYRDSWPSEVFAANSFNLTPYYLKLNEIPKNMVHSDSTYYIYDRFENKLLISSSLFNNKYPATCIWLYPQNFTREICQQVIALVKEYNENIHALEILRDGKINYYWGASDCTDNSICIKDLNMSYCNSSLDFEKQLEYKIWF